MTFHAIGGPERPNPINADVVMALRLTVILAPIPQRPTWSRLQT